MFSETLVYPLKAGYTALGTEQSTSLEWLKQHFPRDAHSFAEIRGAALHPTMCAIEFKPPDSVRVFTPTENRGCCLNGKPLTASTDATMSHNDRLLLGNHHFFRLVNPALAKTTLENHHDWEFAYAEVQRERSSRSESTKPTAAVSRYFV